MTADTVTRLERTDTKDTKGTKADRPSRGGRLVAAVRAARQRRPVEGLDARVGAVPAGLTALGIATWNVHSCVGLDARFAPDRIAEVIRDLDIDIIGLQEVGWHHRGETGLDQFEYLARATGLTAHAGPTKHNASAHYGNALLTRFPVRALRPIDLTVGRREPRGALDADLVIDGVGGSGGGSRLLRVIVAHFGLEPWERKVQVERILQAVALSPERPTLFMGDLNEWRPTSPRLRRLQGLFPDCASPRSFHARIPTLRLDRIFVSPHLLLANFAVVRSSLTRRASDHLPVRATVALRDSL